MSNCQKYRKDKQLQTEKLNETFLFGIAAHLLKFRRDRGRFLNFSSEKFSSFAGLKESFLHTEMISEVSKEIFAHR